MLKAFPPIIDGIVTFIQIKFRVYLNSEKSLNAKFKNYEKLTLEAPDYCGLMLGLNTKLW